MECEDMIKPDMDQINDVATQDFPPGMAPKMLNLVKLMNDLENELKSLTSQPYHEVLNKLSPLERAKVGMMEIYTINSLFWVLMKASGEDTDSTLRDDWKVEMGRLKETQTRLSEVEARPYRSQVDTKAASRFIKRGLGINDRREQSDEGCSSLSHKKKGGKVIKYITGFESRSVSEVEEDSSEESFEVISRKKDKRCWYGKGW